MSFICQLMKKMTRSLFSFDTGRAFRQVNFAQQCSLPTNVGDGKVTRGFDFSSREKACSVKIMLFFCKIFLLSISQIDQFRGSGMQTIKTSKKAPLYIFRERSGLRGDRATLDDFTTHRILSWRRLSVVFAL